MSWLDAQAEFLEVEGASIAYRRLGPPGAPGVVLIHGGAAHSGWWIDVVPELSEDHQVIVPELSGHGDSTHRTAYGTAQWARELAAVMVACGCESAHVVGHSLGGFVTLQMAARHPGFVRSALLIDTALVRKPSPLRSLAGRQVRHYVSLEEGITNFRLRPRGTIARPETLEHIARRGLREDEDGWRWKFDPQALSRVSRDELFGSLHTIKCPIAFIFGEHSEVVDPDTVDFLEQAVGRPIPRESIRGAFHHVPIDTPADTVAAIRRSDGPAEQRLAAGVAPSTRRSEQGGPAGGEQPAR